MCEADLLQKQMMEFLIGREREREREKCLIIA
uniref:Uncharacterized protein n=1 Tax=Arundo donax TaxID=35708 RepID=A0A0A8ZFJ4_ARUDO